MGAGRGLTRLRATVGSILAMAAAVAGCGVGGGPDRQVRADETDPVDTDFVEVPYRLVKNQRLIDVEVMGAGPFTFLVDTGVQRVILATHVAREVGVELDESTAQELEGGAADGATLYRSSLPNLSVGGVSVDSLDIDVLPLTAISGALGVRLDGILGDGFLRRFVVRIDNVVGTFAVARHLKTFERDVARATYRMPISFHPGGDMPVVSGVLNGRGFEATLDLGSSLGLELFTPYADEFGLGHAFDEWPADTILGGSLGRAEVYDGVVERVDVGPMRFDEAPVTISPARGPADTIREGNIGNAFWVDYVLILDYPGGEIVFRKAR